LIIISTVIFIIRIQNVELPFLQRIFNWFPPILFAYVIPAIFTHALNLDLSSSVIHSYNKGIIIPLAVLSVMSALSVKQLRMVGTKPIILFVAGSFIIAVLPPILVVLYQFIDPTSADQIMTEGLWRGLVPMVGSWIGGSTSQLVLKEVVNCSEELFVTILVLDNILVNIWTILMFQFIKRSDKINRWFNIRGEKPQLSYIEVRNATRRDTWITISVVSIISIGFYVMDISFLSKVVILSFIGLGLGNLIRFWDSDFVLELGGKLILIIMATLGLKLNFNAFDIPTSLIVISIIWLIFHFVGMMAVAYVLKIHAAWIPIASMANLGGISTAPAVTAAYEEQWMPHAIVLAILSMVSGTAWGLFSIFLFEWILL
jgi:uncharacterized membrane protein